MRFTTILALTSILFAPNFGHSASADNISPRITKHEDVVYSVEQPNREIYGTGIASRATEASILRLEAERDLQAGKAHDAVRKARKAAQFDPNEADSHLLLARALTACVKADGFKDKQLYDDCVREWRLLRWHDANSSNQDEAGRNLAKLRLARAWSKVKAPQYKSVPM